MKAESLNRWIIAGEIKAVIKKFLAHKNPGVDGFTGEFYKTFKEELTSILLRLFQKIQEDKDFQTLFTKTVSSESQNQIKTQQRENYKPISLMNIDAKILNKILANQNQDYTKNVIHHDQVGFISGMQGWYNIWKLINVIRHIKRIKNKTT